MTTDYSGLVEEEQDDKTIGQAVKLLLTFADMADEDGSGGALQELIEKSEERLANFTSNMTRTINGLKEQRDARAASQKS